MTRPTGDAPSVMVPSGAVQRLILAADCYGVRHLDSDDMSDEAVELQDATEAMKDLIAAPQQSPGGEGWQDISMHDNSMDEVQVMADGFKAPITAWRHHPSSRTDRWLSVPGHYRVKPTHFRPLPPVPSVPQDHGSSLRDTHRGAADSGSSNEGVRG